MSVPTLLPSGQLHPDLVNNAAFVKYVNGGAAGPEEKQGKSSAAERTTAAAAKRDVYTPKESAAADTGIYKPGVSMVEQMKSDLESIKLRFLQMAAEALNQQGKQAVTADDSLWRLLSQGSFTVDAEIQAKAQEAISADGYWGVSQTALRIVGFGQALTNSNTSMIETLKEAFIAGYQAAQDTWGGALPDIARDTYDEVMRLFDEWAADGSGESVSTSGDVENVDLSVEKVYQKTQEAAAESSAPQTGGKLMSQEEMLERANARIKEALARDEINSDPEAQAAKSEKMLAQLDRLDLFESVGNPLNIDGMILDARKVECLAGSVTVTIDVDALGQLEGTPQRPGGHRPPHGHRGPEHGGRPDGPRHDHRGPEYDRRPDGHHRPEHGGAPDGPHHGRPPMQPERPERPPQTGGENDEAKETNASPSTVSKEQVEAFRQRVLEGRGKRDHTIITILAYAGLRISEALDLELEDVDLVSREIRVCRGKGDKFRVVFIGEKVVNAVKEYLRERPKTDKPYLFISRKGGRLSRSQVNRIFNAYSDCITPHTLRHYFCSAAIEAGYSINEVANQAGHSNIHTTLLYTNPTREKMKEKANLL